MHLSVLDRYPHPFLGLRQPQVMWLLMFHVRWRTYDHAVEKQ